MWSGLRQVNETLRKIDTRIHARFDWLTPAAAWQELPVCLIKASSSCQSMIGMSTWSDSALSWPGSWPFSGWFGTFHLGSLSIIDWHAYVSRWCMRPSWLGSRPINQPALLWTKRPKWKPDRGKIWELDWASFGFTSLRPANKLALEPLASFSLPFSYWIEGERKSEWTNQPGDFVCVCAFLIDFERRFTMNNESWLIFFIIRPWAMMINSHTYKACWTRA